MGTAFNGDGTVPRATNPWSPIGIASVTNIGGFNLVTTTPVHNFGDGDTVSIEGTLAPTANGTWQIVVTGSHTFVLTGSVYVSSAGAQGYALDYSVNPLISLPDDGDPLDVSTVNPALEESANIVPYIYQRVGQYSLLNQEILAYSASIGAGVYSTTSVASGDGWKLLTGTDTTGVYSPWRLKTGDLLEVEWTSGVSVTVSGTRAGLAIGLAFNGGGFAEAGESIIAVPDASLGSLIVRGLIDPSNIGFTSGASVGFCLMGHVTSTTLSFALFGPWHLSVKHYRLNT